LPSSVISLSKLSDSRAFDVRVVNSVIDFYNAVPMPPEDGQKIDLQALAAARFDWLPVELKKRADALGIQIPKWEGDSERDLLIAWGITGALLYGHVGHGFPDHAILSKFMFGKVMTLEEFLEKALSPLPIHVRYRFVESQIHRVELPLLTTVQRCVAYMIALVMENRWLLGGRFRRCPFERPGRHFFLDYRLTPDGDGFLPGEQEYCCPEHSNAHRQQRYRERSKTRARKAK
jgi:hypothetical protein